MISNEITTLKLNKMENWDWNKNEYVETSKELKRFFKDIENVCKKHGYHVIVANGIV